MWWLLPIREALDASGARGSDASRVVVVVAVGGGQCAAGVRRVRAEDHGPVGAAGVGALVACPLPQVFGVPRRPGRRAQLLHEGRPALLPTRLRQVSILKYIEAKLPC